MAAPIPPRDPLFEVEQPCSARSRNPVQAPIAPASIAARRGTQVAVVAFACRLAGILYALLRDGSVFEPQRVRHPRPTAAVLVAR
jgi:hypothetical protein